MRVEDVSDILKVIENGLVNKPSTHAELVALHTKLSVYLASELVKDLSMIEQKAALMAMGSLKEMEVRCGCFNKKSM